MNRLLVESSKVQNMSDEVNSFHESVSHSMMFFGAKQIARIYTA